MLLSRKYTVTGQTADMLGDDPRAKETYYAPGDTMIDHYGADEINNSVDNYAKKYAHVMPQSDWYFGNNLVFIRLADIYLLYSEVQILKGNMAEAITYINTVKERAGIETINGTFSADELMDILRQERFRELCGEGSYWFDLIRWDMAETLLAGRGFQKGVHEVLPIPQSILGSNPGIEPNPGY
jgi:hypothetical protein